MNKLYRAVILCCFIISLVVIQQRGGDTAVAQSAQDNRFGAVESFWAPNEAADLGVGWERILFYWNEIQPNGPDDWNTLHVPEEWLNEANAQGRQVVGLLKNTPNWATDGAFAAGVPNGLYLPLDDPGNLWANYVRRVAGYYGQRGVNNWIIWNEPDIAPDVYGHEFSGTMNDYVQLLKVGYLVIKQTNPAAKVHLGGLTHWHDPGYLGRLMQRIATEPDAAANNYFFDVVSLHIYFRPETISTIVGNGFFAQQQAGISPLKAVWINETNARPSMDPEWPVEVQSFPVDLDQQAWFIPQAYALGFYAGAGRIAVYKLVDVNLPPGGESWGLIRPHDFSRRPAYFAYQTTIDYLAGFTYPILRQQSGNHYLFTFNRPQGVTRLMWAKTAAATTLRVPALADRALLVQTNGEAIEIVPEAGFYQIQLAGARCHGECLMGGPPIFLVEEGVQADNGPVAPPVVSSPTPGPDESTLTPTAPPSETVSPTETAVPPTNTPTPTSTPTQTASPLPTSPTATTILPTETPPPTQTAAATEIALIVETAVGTEISSTAPDQSIQISERLQGGTLLIGIGVAMLIILLIIWGVYQAQRE